MVVGVGVDVLELRFFFFHLGHIACAVISEGGHLGVVVAGNVDEALVGIVGEVVHGHVIALGLGDLFEQLAVVAGTGVGIVVFLAARKSQCSDGAGHQEKFFHK